MTIPETEVTQDNSHGWTTDDGYNFYSNDCNQIELKDWNGNIFKLVIKDGFWIIDLNGMRKSDRFKYIDSKGRKRIAIIDNDQE